MLQVSNRRVCSYLRILPNTKINLSSSLRKARVPFGWNYPRLGFSRSRYATNFCRCFSNIRYWSSWAGKNRSLLPIEMLRLDACVSRSDHRHFFAFVEPIPQRAVTSTYSSAHETCDEVEYISGIAYGHTHIHLTLCSRYLCSGHS